MNEKSQEKAELALSDSVIISHPNMVRKDIREAGRTAKLLQENGVSRRIERQIFLHRYSALCATLLQNIYG